MGKKKASKPKSTGATQSASTTARKPQNVAASAPFSQEGHPKDLDEMLISKYNYHRHGPPLVVSRTSAVAHYIELMYFLDTTQCRCRVTDFVDFNPMQMAMMIGADPQICASLGGISAHEASELMGSWFSGRARMQVERNKDPENYSFHSDDYFPDDELRNAPVSDSIAKGTIVEKLTSKYHKEMKAKLEVEYNVKELGFSDADVDEMIGYIMFSDDVEDVLNSAMFQDRLRPSKRAPLLLQINADCLLDSINEYEFVCSNELIHARMVALGCFLEMGDLELRFQYGRETKISKGRPPVHELSAFTLMSIFQEESGTGGYVDGAELEDIYRCFRFLDGREIVRKIREEEDPTYQYIPETPFPKVLSFDEPPACFEGLTESKVRQLKAEFLRNGSTDKGFTSRDIIEMIGFQFAVKLKDPKTTMEREEWQERLKSNKKIDALRQKQKKASDRGLTQGSSEQLKSSHFDPNTEGVAGSTTTSTTTGGGGVTEPPTREKVCVSSLKTPTATPIVTWEWSEPPGFNVNKASQDDLTQFIVTHAGCTDTKYLENRKKLAQSTIKSQKSMTPATLHLLVFQDDFKGVVDWFRKFNEIGYESRHIKLTRDFYAERLNAKDTCGRTALHYVRSSKLLDELRLSLLDKCLFTPEEVRQVKDGFIFKKNHCVFCDINCTWGNGSPDHPRYDPYRDPYADDSGMGVTWCRADDQQWECALFDEIKHKQNQDQTFWCCEDCKNKLPMPWGYEEYRPPHKTAAGKANAKKKNFWSEGQSPIAALASFFGGDTGPRGELAEDNVTPRIVCCLEMNCLDEDGHTPLDRVLKDLNRLTEEKQKLVNYLRTCGAKTSQELRGGAGVRSESNSSGSTGARESSSLPTATDNTSSLTDCASCSKSGAKGRCTACRSVVYCSAECQKADWKRHKKICKDLQQQQKKAAQPRLKE